MLLSRDSIVGISIPSSMSLLASLFTRFVIHHLTTNSLVTLVESLLWCVLPRGPRDTSPIHGLTNPKSWSMPTKQTPSDIPVDHLYDHPVTLWRLIAHKAFLRCLGVAWSHGLRKWYLTFGKALANELHDLCAMLRIGSCPSHYSPNDVIPLSTTSNVHSQETMTICWSQRASQLEAH